MRRYPWQAKPVLSIFVMLGWGYSLRPSPSTWTSREGSKSFDNGVMKNDHLHVRKMCNLSVRFAVPHSSAQRDPGNIRQGKAAEEGHLLLGSNTCLKIFSSTIDEIEPTCPVS